MANIANTLYDRPDRVGRQIGKAIDLQRFNSAK